MMVMMMTIDDDDDNESAMWNLQILQCMQKQAVPQENTAQQLSFELLHFKYNFIHWFQSVNDFFFNLKTRLSFTGLLTL